MHVNFAWTTSPIASKNNREINEFIQWLKKVASVFVGFFQPFLKSRSQKIEGNFANAILNYSKVPNYLYIFFLSFTFGLGTLPLSLILPMSFHFQICRFVNAHIFYTIKLIFSSADFGNHWRFFFILTKKTRFKVDLALLEMLQKCTLPSQ